MGTITVSLSQTGLGYSPSNPVLWPSGPTKFTWQVAAATSTSTPMFVRSSIHATGNNAGSVTWDIPAPDINGNVDHFSATFNNTSTQLVGDPGVAFSVVNRYNGFVIDGGSTIRDKGTSIWVWELVFALVGLIAGWGVGYFASAAPNGWNALLGFAAGLVLGGGASAMMRSRSAGG